jgi:hypothetical protein
MPGWTDGCNVRIDIRWGAGNAADTRKYAAELVALAPDVILAVSQNVGPLLQATRTVPIVFVIVPDPVGSGFVDSLSRPGGNATGFMMFEYSLCGKWLELLKEIAPRVTRAAVLWDPTIPSGIGQFAVIQSVAPSVGVDVSPINMGDAAEIERAVAAFARAANGGLIMADSALAVVHRDLIFTLAARYKLPAVGRECRQSLILTVRPAIFDRHVFSLGIAGFIQTLPDCGQIGHISFGRSAAEIANHGHRLLRARREWPGDRRATTDQRNKIPSSHATQSCPDLKRVRRTTPTNTATTTTP